MAKRPFAKSSRKINVISSVRDDMFGKRKSYPRVSMGANRNIFRKHNMVDAGEIPTTRRKYETTKF
jgi:hypothetical protein